MFGTHTVKKPLKPVQKTTPEDYAGICGIYWEGNAWYELWDRTCATQEESVLCRLCPIYMCAKQRGVAHCGVCPEFPCFLLVNLAAQVGPADIRIESAAKRAELGDARWAEWARERKIWLHAFCPLRTPGGVPGRGSGANRTGEGREPQGRR